MAAEAVTLDRIYAAIKGDYLSGLYPPDDRIDLQSIADRHRASTTPVREAIHRLIGERLFETHPDGGFKIVTVETLGLAHLYTWYGQQILIALHILRNASLSRALEPFRRIDISTGTLGRVDRVDRIFQEIADATGNLELIAQIAQSNERLRYPRLAEITLFPNFNRELRNLTRNGNLSGVSNVKRRIAAYHDRRILHATEIAAAVRTIADVP